MSTANPDLPVVFTGQIDQLLDTAAGGLRTGSWRDFYADDADLGIHGFLVPHDLSSFVAAAVGVNLRLAPMVKHVTLFITEGAAGHQSAVVAVYLTDHFLVSGAPFDVDRLLPQLDDDLAANAGAVLREVARHANAAIASLVFYTAAEDVTDIGDVQQADEAGA